ncbi:MAG: ABC transporter permease [Verrucomicrobia bacterium]|nr:ABC transporter permease [Verrucomicrobiota bacterium]
MRINRIHFQFFLAAAIVMLFSFSAPHFLTAGNLFALMQAFALLGLLTLALGLTMIAGEFDLSVGSMVSLAGLCAVKLGQENPFFGVAVAAGLGIVIGLANGILFRALRISSLVVTVGTMIVLTGLSFWIAGGRVVSYENLDVADWLEKSILFALSPRSLITLLVFVLAWLFLGQTKIGRDIYATGSHRLAAEAAGARVTFTLILVFALSGCISAVAGSLLALSLATASATLGDNLMLQAASAAILGGVALSGGIGSALGMALGAFTLSALNNGLSIMGANSPTILLSNGLLLLGVVLFDSMTEQRGKRIFRLKQGHS